MTRNPPTTRLRNRELRLGLAVAALLRGSPKSNVQSPKSQDQSQQGSSPTVNEGVTFKDQSPKSKNQFPSLEELSGLVCYLGAGALAWWRIRDTDLAGSAAGVELHGVYRQQRLAALRHERDIREVISLLRNEGIEPVLVKGWAIARHYPELGLRPYGDIDLCISPTQFAKASQVLKRIESLNGPFVDLHCGFSGIGVGKRLSISRHFIDEQADWDELYSRTQIVSLSEVQSPKSKVYVPSEDVGHWTLDIGQDFAVRVLSDEDHLRILCLHLLRSGARRPSWLCDVAELLRRQTADGRRQEEQRPKTKDQSPKSRVPGSKFQVPSSEFDWDVCLGRNSVHANWIMTAVLLAHELLGADISHTPFAGQQLPRWIVDAALQQWGGRHVQSPTSNVQSLGWVNRLWTLDIGRWTNLYRRWDNPIRATAAVNGKFTNRSRLRYRLAELIKRIPELPEHFKMLRVDSRQYRVDSRESRVETPQLIRV